MKLALVLEKHEYKGINKVPPPRVYTVMYLLDAAVRSLVHSFVPERFVWLLLAMCWVLFLVLRRIS